jgi:large subunit ribosomal protein L32e
MTSKKAKPAGKAPVRKEAASGLRARKTLKSKKPAFKRQEGWRHAKLKDAWRKPKGRHSKQRKGEKARGKTVRIGYGSPSEVKGLNRLGYREVRVHGPGDIEGLDPREEMVVIASSVGRKKREELLKIAAEKNLHVANS